MTNFDPTPQEAPLEVATARRRATIGLPKCQNSSEKRFPLTPEAVGVLTRQGFSVVMESGAAEYIHYSDNAYVKSGATIATRRDTLQCDIVIHLAPLSVSDIKQLNRGALLLSLANFQRQGAAEVINDLLQRRIVNIAIDLIRDREGNRPFGDILSEIEGRSAMTVAAGMLADPLNGKGILLGGIAGVVPCEVTIIGSNIAACAAAKSALGLGAMVRLFDDNVYRLRTALRQVGNGIIGSSLRPHALENALRSADVVIVTESGAEMVIDGDITSVMKKKVLLFDISDEPGKAFPKAVATDLGLAERFFGDDQRRIAYTNPGATVPRTAAMALSDTFITLLRQIADCDGAPTRLPMTPGLQEATLTFMGKAVNERVAQLAGVRYTDIQILLSLG